MKYIDQVEVAGKRVLLRVDFNVPLDESGRVADDNRIRGALPTIQYLLDQGASVIICSHLGRPKGERNPAFSLAPAASALGSLIGREVPLAPDCVGPEAREAVSAMGKGGILMLENLRFHKEETGNYREFAAELASMADCYCNDAFAVSHRAHASVVGVTEHIGECAAGFLIKKEMDYFNQAMVSPARPVAAVLGGAKVSSKLGAIENIMEKVDKILIGGAMANTFLKAQGFHVGGSLVEDELLETAGSIIETAGKRGVKLYLPVDVVVSTSMDCHSTPIRIVPVQEIGGNEMVLDIGQATIDLFREALHNVETIVWNGPLGAFENVPFSLGTISMARTIASSPALSIVGGGDTGLAVHMAGEADRISYISTGGGAFLMLLEGKELPGLSALGRCGG